MKNVVVIGGGQAGLQICESVRRDGFDGEVWLVGSENSLPYQRPPLSKNFLLGKTEPERLLIRPETFFKKYHINYLLDTSAISVDRDRKIVKLADETSLSYDKLALTTGSRVRRLEGVENSTNVFYIRDIRDASEFSSKLEAVKTVAVVGGGFIGLEVAAICNQLEKSVTVLEQAASLMARNLPPQLASYYESVHQKKGVELMLRATVKKITPYSDRVDITVDGIERSFDAVVVGIGVVPNIELALECGLDCQNGILADVGGHTSDDSIFTAGDCASFFSSYYEKHVRLESVQNAVDTGKVVAENMLGKDKDYDSVPWFWSDQYHLKLQITGILEPFDDAILLGKMEDASFSVFYFHQGRHVGTASINKPSDHMKSRKLLSKRSSLSADVVKQPDFDLQTFMKAHT